MASMPQTEMTPDTILKDPEQYKIAQDILAYLGYCDEADKTNDAKWKPALAKFRSEYKYGTDPVLDVKTFAALAKAFTFRKLRNYTIGAAVLGAVGYGGWYAYKHYYSKSRAELVAGDYYDTRTFLPNYE